MKNELSDLSVSKIQRVQLVCVAFFTAVALLYSLEMAGSVAVGGLLSLLSFAWLKRDISSIFSGPLGAVKVFFFIKYYARLTLMAVVLFILVRHRILNVIGLLAGLSTAVCSITIAGAGQVRKLYVNAKEAA
ncbi:MAG: ATP synthase subunit I [Deltaproteobacteria bacterium]